MDNHLNFFYSYSQGDLDNIDDERVLEDNITRALIITLKENPYLTKAILEKLFENKLKIPTIVKKDDFKYDLQNLSDNPLLKRIQGYSRKFILCISPVEDDKANLAKEKLVKFKDIQIEPIIEWIDNLYELQNQNNKKAKEQLKEFRKNIVSCIAKIKNITLGDSQNENQALIKATQEIFYDENKKCRFESYDNKFEVDSFAWASIKALNYLHDVCFGSRPDAWIWTDKFEDNFVVLIENKINGGLYEEQIIRHVKRKTGIYSKINDIEIEIITWEKLLNFLELELKKKQSTSENEEANKKLIEHFIKYLNLKNIVMNLNFVVEEGYDRVKARKQFNLLLPKLTDKIKGLIPDLDRRDRPLADHIWDYYGIKRKIPRPKSKKSKDYILVEEITTDPHYSVYFDVNGAGISLTTKIPKLMEIMLDNKHLKEFLENVLKKELSLSRYSLSLGGYGLFDFKKHAQRGETINTFAFNFNFSKLVTVYKNQMKKKSNCSIEKVLFDMKQYVKFSKQCELGITIRYPKKGKADNEDIEVYKETKENTKLFKDPDKLLEVYKDFITNTKDLFAELNNEKTKMVNQDIEKKRKKYKFVD